MIKGNAFTEIKKNFEEDFKNLKEEAKKTEREPQQKRAKDYVNKFQSTKKNDALNIFAKCKSKLSKN